MASLAVQLVKESSFNAGGLGSIPGSGRSLKEGMATHSSSPPWTEEPHTLQSMGWLRLGQNIYRTSCTSAPREDAGDTK